MAKILEVVTNIMRQIVVYLIVLIGVLGVIVYGYKNPPETIDAKPYTIWSDTAIRNSRRGAINIPFTDSDGNADSVNLLRLDLQGDSYSRGYSHGYLLAREIVEFTGPQLDKYFIQEIMGIDISKFPEPIQKILGIIQLRGAVTAPAAFREALAYIWSIEEKYTPQYLLDELNGMGNGLCDALKDPKCDAVAWSLKLKQVNMLPELVRMACTAFGAWGKSTATKNGLIQLRALDFGGGPFANYTVISVTHDETTNNPFVSVSFPAFVGVITGISKSGLGISQKVWTVNGNKQFQPGTFEGEADIFALRDILQYSKTREDAENYLKTIRRNWAIWIGIGDFSSNQMDLVGYKQDSVGVYNDLTAPNMTGQPYMESLVYVDKHQQPSLDGPNGTLPTVLGDLYGQLSLDTAKIVAQYHETGDLHIATYDYVENILCVSIGRINQQGQYGPEGGNDFTAWKAYNRPYARFDLNDLWNGV